MSLISKIKKLESTLNELEKKIAYIKAQRGMYEKTMVDIKKQLKEQYGTDDIKRLSELYDKRSKKLEVVLRQSEEKLSDIRSEVEKLMSLLNKEKESPSDSDNLDFLEEFDV